GLVNFDFISLNNVTLFGENPNDGLDPCISNSDLFTSGSNESWPYIFTACTDDDGNMGEEQTLEINIISLPDGGANYRIAKTTANGQFFFGNPQPLSLGLNTLTVTSVTFARTVKFQFDNGNICFDSLDLNNQSVLSSTLTDIYNLSIYPNPTKSMLFIDGNEDIISIELISISGRSLMQVINTNQLDISSFSTGVYFLKVNDGTTSVVKKIIKQ
ncbi:MAG: T9SS type A sorting domain-containing protein, partial [Bacteroidota bacterium]|nr:T9SS type A sorting domain-containing protein [Bacteroidota bacterium]